MGRDGRLRRGFSLYHLDAALLAYARRHLAPGAESDSAALRFILRDWAQMRGLDVGEVLREAPEAETRPAWVDPEVVSAP